MQTKTVNESWSPADLIDLERYPILDLSGAATRELTRHCRDQLDRTGACELPEFLKPDAVAMLVREADSLAARAYHSVVTGTPYLEAPDPSGRTIIRVNFSSRPRSVSLLTISFPAIRRCANCSNGIR